MHDLNAKMSGCAAWRGAKILSRFKTSQVELCTAFYWAQHQSQKEKINDQKSNKTIPFTA